MNTTRTPRRLLLLALLATALAGSLILGVVGSRLDQASASNIAAVAGGAVHSCLITSDGNVKCWGSNSDGQFGIGHNPGNFLVPQDVPLPGPAAGLALGRFHGCFLLEAGGVRCAGGSFYTGTGEYSNSPVAPTGLGSNIVQISSTFWHTCAVTDEHDLYCWGYDSYGQIGGDCEFDVCLLPVEVTAVRGEVASVVAGRSHTCILTTSGTVKCWGENRFGQLGNGLTTDSASPVDVLGLDQEVLSISAYFHTCVLTVAADVKCWGLNNHGQLGDQNTGTDSSVPVDVVGLDDDVVAVTAGGFFTCVVHTGGGAKCWGTNENRESGWWPTLPIETPIPDSAIPHDVDGFTSGATAIDAGDQHTCVVVYGGVKCWGVGFGWAVMDVPGVPAKPLPTPTPTDIVTATPTATATPTPTITPTPAKQPHPGDTDGDGCSDQRENGLDETLGGQRDYNNPWDFYDVAGPGGGPKDGVIDLPNDILGVIQHLHAYDVRYDRGPSVGPNPWNMTAPDGVIDLPNDVLGVILQFGHRCT